jgi:GNAT superfamily N-acetyltransferase
MVQVLRIEGWRSRRIARVTFYRCPECGDCQDVLFAGRNGTVKCLACNKSSLRNAFTVGTKRRVIAQCAHGGDEVPFVPSTAGIVGPLCPNLECSNYVAVAYGNTYVEPRLVLDPRWNRGLRDRAERVAGGLLLVRCKSKRDYIVLKVLQVLAKQDDARFKFANPSEHRSAVCFDAKRRKYLGFLIWTEDKTAVLRQLFVVKRERRKGHASKMVTFWIERFAKSLGGQFGIEGPNEAALGLHVKLGHVRIEGSNAVGVKCHFAPTL